MALSCRVCRRDADATGNRRLTGSTSTLGFIGGILTTVAFIPRVIKIWKTKHARDIPLGMYADFLQRRQNLLSF